MRRVKQKVAQFYDNACYLCLQGHAGGHFIQPRGAEPSGRRQWAFFDPVVGTGFDLGGGLFLALIPRAFALSVGRYFSFQPFLICFACDKHVIQTMCQ